jgi:hypothetical protein
LLLIELGALLVSGQEKSNAGVVSFHSTQLGILLVKRSQLDNCVDHKTDIVFVVVVQKNFPGRQRLRGLALGLLLASRLGYGGGRSIV